MERKNRYKIPESFDYESLKTLTENDFLRNGCDPEKIDFLFAMGSEQIEYDPITNNVWYAWQPTGMTLAEYIESINKCDINDM